MQTSKVDKNGVASAKQANNLTVEQAVKLQQEFVKKPYATTVIDNKGEKHKLTNVEDTYDTSSEFEQNSKVISDILGKKKIEAKNGELDTKTVKTDDLVKGIVLNVAVFFMNPLPVMAIAVVVVVFVLYQFVTSDLQAFIYFQF